MQMRAFDTSDQYGGDDEPYPERTMGERGEHERVVWQNLPKIRKDGA
jgi:hypothetical protein